MNRRARTFRCAASGALILCILLERPSLPGIVLGGTLGMLAGLAASGDAPACTRPFTYAAFVLRAIVRSTLHMLRATLRPGDLPIAVVQLPCHAPEQGRALVSNSITLTPGTITLEVNSARYTVLCAAAPAEVSVDLAADLEVRLHRKEG